MESIKATGLKVVALSYDNVDVLQKFASREQIQFPLLADPDSKVLRQLGIVNSSAREGTKKYNIAYPMTILINKDSTVAGVIPATVRDRHSAEQLVAAWGKLAPKSAMSTKTSAKKTPTPLGFTVNNIEGEAVELSKYDGKVVVMVNVASKCGYTPQYETLQKLYTEHKDDGLVILGFPCNQFGGQEPGSETEIQEFCKKNYGVEFDMFSKVDVNGDDAAPLFKHLTAQETKPKGAGAVRWNFEKFVIGRDGKLAGRFGTKVSPDSEEFKLLVSSLLKQGMDMKK